MVTQPAKIAMVASRSEGSTAIPIIFSGFASTGLLHPLGRGPQDLAQGLALSRHL